MEAIQTLDLPDRLSRSEVMARKNKRKRHRTAREARKTHVETVEGAYGRDFDTVERVEIHSIKISGPRLSARQVDAANKYRWAFEYESVVSSSLDASKVGGGVPSSRSPTTKQLAAAEITNDVERICGEEGKLLMQIVIGQGRSVVIAARMIAARYFLPFGAVEVEQKDASKKLRRSLDLLALRWFGREPQRGTIKSFASEGSRPTENRGNYERDPSHHAHAYKDRETGQTIIVSKDGKAVAVGKKS